METDLEKAKMAYSREKKVSVRTVEDSKVSGELAQWLKKYEEAQKKLQIYAQYGPAAGRKGLFRFERRADLMEIPAPNIFSMQTQEMQWDDFEPEEGQRRPNRFNMEIRKDEKDREEKEKDKSRKALL